jgi:hypothetical protein
VTCVVSPIDWVSPLSPWYFTTSEDQRSWKS